MADREIGSEIEALDSTLASIESVLNISTLRARIAELEISASAPDLWDDPENAQKVTSELSNTQDEVAKLGSLRSRLDDLGVLLELAQSEEDSSALADVESELDTLTSAISAMEIRTLLNGEYDARQDKGRAGTRKVRHSLCEFRHQPSLDPDENYPPDFPVWLIESALNEGIEGRLSVPATI